MRRSRVPALILAYSASSSLLLVINKLAIAAIPAPSFILLCQLSSCALFIKVLSAAGAVECEPLSTNKARQFAIIVVGFIATLYANVTALSYVPVDTIICFRASMPLVIACIEYVFMGRELPSPRSWCALAGVFVGVTAYTAVDIHFSVTGYVWLTIWYACAVAEMVFVKQVVDSVRVTTWSRSYYQNVLSVAPLAVVALATNETARVTRDSFTPTSCAILMGSCIAGLGMSYYSFALRSVISATSFSVVGNVCKVVTILISCVALDQHASELKEGCGGLGTLRADIITVFTFPPPPHSPHQTPKARSRCCAACRPVLLTSSLQ